MPKHEFHASELEATMLEMQKSRPILINLWAPPGVGKSSNMAAIFNILKFKGLRAEMAPEVVKVDVYENNRMALLDPFYAAARQEYRSFILKGQVDFIVTDSPTALAALYCQEADAWPLLAMARHMRARYVNVDVRLQRDPSRPYQTYGRNHTEEQSKALEARLDKLLAWITNDVFHRLADTTAAADIVKFVEREVVPYASQVQP